RRNTRPYRRGRHGHGQGPARLPRYRAPTTATTKTTRGYLESHTTTWVEPFCVRRRRLGPVAGPLSHAEPCTQHRRTHRHRRIADPALVDDVDTARSWLLVLPAARGAGRRLPGAPVHDPARLRPRCFLPSPLLQRLGWTRDRGIDAHAVRLLATQARHSPRDVG